MPVKEHQIQVLLKDLRRELRHQHTVSAECKRMEVFVNDDRTRTFLALALQDPSQVSVLPSDRANSPIFCHLGLSVHVRPGRFSFLLTPELPTTGDRLDTTGGRRLFAQPSSTVLSGVRLTRFVCVQPGGCGTIRLAQFDGPSHPVWGVGSKATRVGGVGAR